jgi:hypothetical protein
MSTAFTVEPLSDVARDAAEKPPTRSREDAIRSAVLAALGRPSRLLKVAVLPLWGDKFRVNVWTAADGAGYGIPDSHFVTADDRGTVLTCEPPIRKRY